ncbi:MAG: putative quinol monooxygenase [Cellvibrionaceae bacterium]
MTITRVNHFEAANENGDELYAFLNSLIPYISNSEGCLSVQVLRDSNAKNKFIVLEEWESIETHQLSIANFPKEEMEKAMPLFAGPPQGSYYSR